jgi:hypothetical protein
MGAVIKQIDVFVFKAATNILDASRNLLRRKMMVGFLFNKAYEHQGNKAGKHMCVDPVLT